MLLLLLSLILRNALRAGAILALFLFLFFSCGPVRDVLSGEHLLNETMNRLLPVSWVLPFAAGTALIFRIRIGWENITKTLNVVALVLILPSLVNIGWSQLGTAPSASKRTPTESFGPQITPLQPLPVDPLPDIYYIILDGYARADILQDLYGYDNSQFLDFLAERGFYVAARSAANYCQTVLSLASSLNLSYLDKEAERIGLDNEDRKPVVDLIADSALLRFLSQHGYTLISFRSGFDPSELPSADVPAGSIRRTLNELEERVLLMTPLPWYMVDNIQHKAYTEHAERILFVFDHLPETTELPSPRFVFAHIVAPHPPFVFDAQGNYLFPERLYGLWDGNAFKQEATLKEYLEGYPAVLTYMNQRLVAMLDELLAKSTGPTVVILQSDHGPGSQLDWDSAENTNLRERLSILNAYLLPGEDPVELYDEITPVNSFRLVLNRYFGTDLELLEDRSYFSTWRRPYRFLDVTDELSAE